MNVTLNLAMTGPGFVSNTYNDTSAANNPIGLPAGPLEQELMIADRQFDTQGPAWSMPPTLYTIWRYRQLRRAQRLGVSIEEIVGPPPAWARD